MQLAHTNPKLFVTECGTVLFTYQGLAEYKGGIYDAWQAAFRRLDGLFIHGTIVRPPGYNPDSDCAVELAQQLWDEEDLAEV